MSAGCAAGLAITVLQAQTSPQYHTGIDLVAVNVTVLNDRDQPITGLSRESFAVYEDGVAQDIAYFEARDVDMDLLLLIDTSSSMFERMPFVRTAATAFARVLRPGDRGSVLAFSNRITAREPFTADPSTLARAIATIRASGATALYDSIYIALRDLPRDERVRRRVLVILTDGQDTRSLMTFESVLDEARRAGVTIYAVCIGTQMRPVSPWSATPVWTTRMEFDMKELARDTGGLSFVLRDSVELVDAYARVATDLTQQYLLAYVSKNAGRRDAFRRITIRLPAHPDARLRARSGYLATRLADASATLANRP